MEIGGAGLKAESYLPQICEFRAGRLWPSSRPGLGVELNTQGLQKVAEITERYAPIPTFHRPDGSMTNW
jgi:hypothetical protein